MLDRCSCLITGVCAQTMLAAYNAGHNHYFVLDGGNLSCDPSRPDMYGSHNYYYVQSGGTLDTTCLHRGANYIRLHYMRMRSMQHGGNGPSNRNVASFDNPMYMGAGTSLPPPQPTYATPTHQHAATNGYDTMQPDHDASFANPMNTDAGTYDTVQPGHAMAATQGGYTSSRALHTS